MKIKEIKLYGFKSFPDEAKIMLNAGITAFVGPNGSGKSNIFDALRWIFGEQSMKALRCERIEDLIFVSPDVQREVNFTEVSVTIDNENYFPQFGGEFEIKRRFYRSGDSEFFLNRVKCRLQDIQALFLNSGALTYSFLELSEIEKIIRGDTKDMFNDVSGILKYQERREQTRRVPDLPGSEAGRRPRWRAACVSSDGLPSRGWIPSTKWSGRSATPASPTNAAKPCSSRRTWRSHRVFRNWRPRSWSVNTSTAS